MKTTPTGPQAQEAGVSELLAHEIRRVDGNHSLGAAALADALIPFITSLTPARVVSDDRLLRIGELICTQDNRITSNPVFVVEQKRQYVTDPDYNEGAREVWVGDEGEEVEPRSKGSRKFFVNDVWEFVTACFTEQGCKDYLAVNGHNLREPRIYVHSGYRNQEWIDIRAALSTLQSGAEGKDGVRLDALEAEISSGGPILLHNGVADAKGFRGLGLANTGRSLRKAIDECCDTALQPGKEKEL